MPKGPGKTQNEGQEDQEEVKELGEIPVAVVGFSGPPGLPTGSSLSPLPIHHTSSSVSYLFNGPKWVGNGTNLGNGTVPEEWHPRTPDPARPSGPLALALRALGPGPRRCPKRPRAQIVFRYSQNL